MSIIKKGGVSEKATNLYYICSKCGSTLTTEENCAKDNKCKKCENGIMILAVQVNQTRQLND